ncbi:replication protein RepA [Acidipila sp. EB88]|uniref:replication protein RepA n=1 Tax=Acidipila sp. EB88 TaxID=2305226 RepID=UPI000F5EDA14|nr:replication protein RepA [Acidipila sp. EB88]RRA50354.1 hypothetical protein D1Y84_00925 [Acidipila sp. EB88]RRA50362.1 hypothetical protein D1Y84_00965 [Acidipila sp. EB88]
MAELKKAADILPGLLPKRRRAPGELSKQKLADIAARESFEQQEYGTESLAYMPSQLIQCCFPHDDPGDVPEWSRSTPWLTMSLQPGRKTDRKTGQRVSIGYPFGTVPRLLMFYVMTQIEHQKNQLNQTALEKRTVSLGASLGQFMRAINLNPENGSGKRSDKRRVKEQVERFARVRVSFEQEHQKDDGYAYIDMQVSESGEFWWTSKDTEQTGLFESHITLSESFYRKVLSSLVPLDMAALKALKNSALHLDLYAWCLYRSHTLTKGGKGPLTVEWPSFMAQSGAEYKRVRKFREKVIEALPSVRPYLKHIRVVTDEKGITIHPTRKALIPARL